MITPLAFIILAQAGQARASLFLEFNQYILSQGFERNSESFQIGISYGGHHDLNFYNGKGFRLSFSSHTFGKPVKPGRIFEPNMAAIYQDIPMKVSLAGQVEACVDPKKTRADSVAIRFNIEDAHVYIIYGQAPGRGDKIDRNFINVEEAYKILKPFADKYSALLKAELQTLRREKRVRRNYP